MATISVKKTPQPLDLPHGHNLLGRNETHSRWVLKHTAIKEFSSKFIYFSLFSKMHLSLAKTQNTSVFLSPFIPFSLSLSSRTLTPKLIKTNHHLIILSILLVIQYPFNHLVISINPMKHFVLRCYDIFPVK